MTLLRLFETSVVHVLPLHGVMEGVAAGLTLLRSLVLSKTGCPSSELSRSRAALRALFALLPLLSAIIKRMGHDPTANSTRENITHKDQIDWVMQP